MFISTMRLVTTAEEKRLYMAQWRGAADALKATREAELQLLSDEDARAASSDLLALGPFPLPAERQQTSGLVEQQRIFQKWLHRS